MPDFARFHLAYKRPYDWDGVCAFLAARATPAVEQVGGRGVYRRTITLDGENGTIEVRDEPHRSALRLEVSGIDRRHTPAIRERVRRMFDVDANPAAIHERLARDPLLRRALRAHPGIRTPGAWDGFELAVRAIVGQQVSVRAATTIAGRVAAMFGDAVAPPAVDVTRLFPSPAQLIDAPLERAGVMPSRAETIRRLAHAAHTGAIVLGAHGTQSATMAQLRALPGIGDWTAQYVAMRAFDDGDAFPSGDLILRRAAGGCTPRALERRAEAWRPWRAYAVMLLWRSYAPPLHGSTKAGK